jgi:hypothetical protein
MRDQTFQIPGEYFGDKLQAQKQAQEDRQLLQTVAAQTPNVGDPKLQGQLTGMQYLAIKQQKQEALVQEQQLNIMRQANEQAGLEHAQQEMAAAQAQSQQALEGFLEYAPDV